MIYSYNPGQFDIDLETGALLLVELSNNPEGGATIRKTIVGNILNIAVALAMLLEKYPDLLPAFDAAVRQHKERVK